MANQEQVTTFRIKDFWTDAMQRIIATQDKFEAKVKNIQTSAGKSFDGVRSKLDGFASRHMEVIEGITSRVPGLGALGPAMANPYVIAGTAVLALGAAYGKSVQKALDWDTEMKKANVTLEATPERLQQISDKVLEIGARMGNIKGAPDVFNSLVSGGLSETTAMNAINPVLKAAKAGFADLGVTAQAAIGTMNSTGITDATKALDVLIQTQKAGNAEFTDIANYLPKVIPLAKAVGITFEETAGAYAFYTAQGLKAEQSTTALENVLRAVGDPKKADAFKKMGIELYDANGNMKPLIGTVEAIKQKVDKLTPQGASRLLNTLGLDSEASLGLNMMIQNLDKFKDAVDQTSNSTGALEKAYSDAQGPLDPWKRALAVVDQIMIKIGQTALPWIEKLGLWVESAINYFRDLNSESILFRDHLSAIGTYFGFLWKVSKIPLELTWNILKNIGNTIVWVSDKIGLSGGTFEEMYLKARPGLTWIWEILSKIGDIAYKIITGDIPGMIQAFKDFKLPSLKEITERQNAEVSKMRFDKILDVGLPKSLNPTKPKNPFTKLDYDPGKTTGSGKSGGVSGGGGVKNITITIQQLLPGMTVNATTIQGAAQDIGRMIQEELVKMISDTTLAVE